MSDSSESEEKTSADSSSLNETESDDTTHARRIQQPESKSQSTQKEN